MGDFLKKIFRISTLFKFLTILCLVSLCLAYLAPFVHPNTFWPIPFFGLTYPIIVCCTLAALVVWAIARSRWFFIVLAVLLVGGKLHFRMVSLPFGKEKTAAPENKLKLLSYNVRLFDIYSVMFEQKYANRDSIFTFLKNEKADIVCLQEFYYQDHSTNFPKLDTFYILMQAKHMHNRMSFNKSYKNYFGVAIFSKYPMITRGHVDFDDSIKNSNNFCIYADIIKNRDTFRIYNTHFQSIQFQQDDYAMFGDKAFTGNSKSNINILTDKLFFAYQKRVYQAKKVIEHMDQSPYPVIVCGDFNDTPMSYTYNLFNSKFTDAFRNSSSGLGITYAGKVPAGRIDYIFHSPQLKSNNFRIQDKVYSDHRAISCYFWKE